MSVIWKAWGVGGLVLALSASCGGKSQVEGGGQEPSGAGASNAGAGNSAGAPSTGCPAQAPTQGDACNNEGLGYCSYPIDACSYRNFECIQGFWISAPQTGGASPDCNSFSPPNAPKDGDSCLCLGKLDCQYNDCSSRGQIHAVCDNTSWHVTESACPKQTCGPSGLTCQPGTVCLLDGGQLAKFECVKDPCAPAPTSCDCAAQLCNVGQCMMDRGTVACVCSTC